jgi:DNA-binding response OmpR family regulator
MLPAKEDKIFYVIIVGNNQSDHVFLRKVMNKMLPQAIVESLYCNAEALSFLSHHCLRPDLILLERKALLIDGKNVIPVIKNRVDLKSVPIILLGDEADELGEAVVADTGADAYFFRSYPQNSIDWLARNLEVKWSQCWKSAS